MGILCFLVYAFIIMLVVRAILSWIHPTQGPLAAIDHIAGQITEPVLGPVRRQIPPIRLGGVALDTAFLVVLLVVGRVGTALVCT